MTMELNVIHNTDALSGLRMLPDESIDCIVTSPPYWQMRDYGLDPILWGGDDGCKHAYAAYGFCTRCGGWLGQLGQEPTRDDFIAHLCLIFDECRRVLKPTGTLWVNLGDSYSKPYKYNTRQNPKWYERTKNDSCLIDMYVDKTRHRIPSKSLCNIPNKFADEMILRGWLLRNEVIWHKPACMPASVRDRFTVDFEKLFFFAKNTHYYFNQQFEPYAEATLVRYKTPMALNGKGEEYRRISGRPKGMITADPRGRNMRCVWRVPYEPSKEAHFAMYPSRLVETPIKAGCPEGGIVLDPFMGSGTTAVVARRLGRKYIGFEPNEEYAAICRKRLNINDLSL